MFSFLRKKGAQAGRDFSVAAPVEGRVCELKDCSDPAFAGGMLGDGVVIKPAGDTLVSPIDGEVTTIFPTKHAIGLTGKDGVQILIHIGIDTVKLGGEGFVSHISEGQEIFKGEDMMTIDRPFIVQNGLSDDIVLVITNHEDYKLQKVKMGEVNRGEEILRIQKR